MEERFKQLAALVGQSTRFSSSSTVVLHNVTHKVCEVRVSVIHRLIHPSIHPPTHPSI